MGPTTPTARGNLAGKDLEAEIAAHSHTSHQSGESLSLERQAQHAPFTPIDFLEFDTREDAAPDFPPNKGDDAPEKSMETAVSSAGSIQTPPPTSTSGSRRKAQQAQAARLAKDSAAKRIRRLSSPTLTQGNPDTIHFNNPEESPSNFPNLQFSPDGFSFPMSGPATAPVYPHHKLFWDPDQTSSAMNVDVPMDDTFASFDMGIQKNHDALGFDDDHGNMLPITASPTLNAVRTSTSMSNSRHAPALNETNISPSAGVITPGSSKAKPVGRLVDPSLLFSLPSRAPENIGAPSSRPAGKPDLLQPYAHQIRDAEIEKELKSRKHKRKRAPEHGDSPAVKAAIEALREDSTDVSGTSPVLADSFVRPLADDLLASNQELPRRRKRMTPDSHYQRQNSQSHLQRRKSDNVPAKRTAVSLKIDPDGRAVTETTVISDRPHSTTGSRMDIDSAWEESESSSDTSNEKMVPNLQPHSDPPCRQRHSKQTRFANDYRSHSQRSSNTSTSTSTMAAATTQGMIAPRQGRLVTKAGHAQAHFLSSQSISRQDHDGDNDSGAETIVDSNDENGDAQCELRKVVRERALRKTSNRSSWSAAKSSFVDARRSYTTTAPAPSPYYTHQNIAPSHLAYQEPPNNISPTSIADPHVTTPGSGRESKISSESTRCVCNIADGNGQLMIQW
ncbi:MAG: hypothetical protein Q9163_002560 [Psora crenata]